MFYMYKIKNFLFVLPVSNISQLKYIHQHWQKSRNFCEDFGSPIFIFYLFHQTIISLKSLDFKIINILSAIL